MLRQETKSITWIICNDHIRFENLQLLFHGVRFYATSLDDTSIQIQSINSDYQSQGEREPASSVPLQFLDVQKDLSQIHVICKLYPIPSALQCRDWTEEEQREYERDKETDSEIETTTLTNDVYFHNENVPMSQSFRKSISNYFVGCMQTKLTHADIFNPINGCVFPVCVDRKQPLIPSVKMCMSITVNLDGPVEPETTYALK